MEISNFSVTQGVNKFTAFYGTQRLNTMFTRTDTGYPKPDEFIPHTHSLSA